MSERTSVEASRTIDAMLVRYAQIEALLPDCPTCGGTTMIACDGPPRCYGMHMGHPCPDCKDTPGKASIPWMVATFNAVHTPDWEDVDGTVHEVIAHLQSVRP